MNDNNNNKNAPPSPQQVFIDRHHSPISVSKKKAVDTTTEQGNRSAARPKNISFPENAETTDHYDRELDKAWKSNANEEGEEVEFLYETSSNNNNNSSTAAMETTIALCKRQIDDLVQYGLEAFQELEATTRRLEQSQQLRASSEQELARLRLTQEQNQSTITNLMRAVEQSKSDTRNASRVASVETRLRRDASELRSERDEALGALTESKRNIHILEEQIRMLKTKLSRCLQEKISLERESRAALSLAKSLDTHANSDTEFYKRKAAELNDNLQKQQALVAEQKLQIKDLQRKLNHYAGQKRVASISAESSAKKIEKKARKF